MANGGLAFATSGTKTYNIGGLAGSGNIALNNGVSAGTLTLNVAGSQEATRPIRASKVAAALFARRRHPRAHQYGYLHWQDDDRRRHSGRRQHRRYGGMVTAGNVSVTNSGAMLPSKAARPAASSPWPTSAPCSAVP